jgi:hypothetical protein
MHRESVELFVTRGIDEIGDPAAAAVAQARALERLGVPPFRGGAALR